MVSRFKLGFHLPGVDVVIASFKNKEVVHTATVVAHDIADFESNYILLQRSGQDKQYMICSTTVLGVNVYTVQAILRGTSCTVLYSVSGSLLRMLTCRTICAGESNITNTNTCFLQVRLAVPFVVTIRTARFCAALGRIYYLQWIFEIVHKLVV